MAIKPIIIKRKKGGDGHGGHHGGAWKVAYADFVTAMMAFFLMMWLLNATTEQQRRGLADYFDSRVPISRISGGGDGALKGDSLTAAEELAESGGGMAPVADGRAATVGEADNDPKPQLKAEKAAGEAERFEAVRQTIRSLGGESRVADALLSHIRTRVSDEGLVIEVFDSAEAPLFAEGGAEPTPMMRALASVVAEVSRLVTNDVAIAGHVAPTAASDPAAAEAAWALSTERAQAARRLMIGTGMDPTRIAGVTGHAGARPLSPDPDDPANRRVEITLLRDFPAR